MSWFQNITSWAGDVGKRARAILSFAAGGRMHGGDTLQNHYEQATMFRGWSYVAVHRIATAAMSAEVKVTTEDDDGNATELKRTDWRRTIIEHPSRHMSRALFTYYRIQQLLLTGVSYTWDAAGEKRDGQYHILGRHVMPTGMVTFSGGQYRLNAATSGGVVQQDFLSGDGVTAGYSLDIASALSHGIPMDEVNRVFMPHPLTTSAGYSPLEAAKPWIDIANDNDECHAAHLRNRFTPSVIMTGKFGFASQEEADAASQRYVQKYTGATNASKLMLVDGEDAVTVTPLTVPPKDMEYNNTNQVARANVFAIFGLPGIAAGVDEGGSYAGLMASLKQLNLTSLQPLLDMLAAEDMAMLRRATGDSSVTVKYEAPPINDDELRMRKATEMRTGRYVTVNEWREMIGLPPLAGEMEETGNKTFADLEAEQQQQQQQAQMPPMDGAEADGQPNMDEEQIGGFGGEATNEDDAVDQRYTEDPIGKSADPLIIAYEKALNGSY